MNNINIEIMDNDVKVIINNKYIGHAPLEGFYNYSCSTPMFISSIFGPMVNAMNEAKEKMIWPRFLDEFYYPDTSSGSMYGSGIWHGHIQEEKMKERGLVFRTKEEAIETSKKMLEAIK